MIGADGNGVAYTYHADGSLAKVSPATGSSTAFTATDASSISYTYDSRDRLTAITTATATYGFTYDAFGNMLSVSVDGGVPQEAKEPKKASPKQAAGRIQAAFGRRKRMTF